MKYTFAATAIVLATAAASAASTSSPPIWQGDLFITTASTSTAACNGAGIATGGVVQAIFAAKNLPNIPSDQLAVFFPGGSAHQIVPKSGTSLNGATSVTITHIKHDASLKTEIVTLPGAIKISSPASGTQSLTVPVSDLGATGCNVTFNGVLIPRPGSLQN